MADMGGEGFDDFVAGALPRLLRLGHLLTGTPHDAWDLTQECLLRVGLAWSRVDAKGNPEGYARQAMVRLHVSRWRRVRREVLGSTRVEPVAPDSLDGVELAPTLRWALDQLGPRQRAAIVLRYYCDLTTAQVADHLGCSVGNAKSQVSRGTARLQELLVTDPRVDGAPRHGQVNGDG